MSDKTTAKWVHVANYQHKHQLTEVYAKQRDCPPERVDLYKNINSTKKILHHFISDRILQRLVGQSAWLVASGSGFASSKSHWWQQADRLTIIAPAPLGKKNLQCCQHCRRPFRRLNKD